MGQHGCLDNRADSSKGRAGSSSTAARGHHRHHECHGDGIYMDHANLVMIFNRQATHVAEHQEIWQRLWQATVARSGFGKLFWLPSHLDRKEKLKRALCIPPQAVLHAGFLEYTLASAGAALEEVPQQEVKTHRSHPQGGKVGALKVAEAVGMAQEERGEKERLIKEAKARRKEERPENLTLSQEKARSSHTRWLVSTAGRTHWRCTTCLRQHKAEGAVGFFRSRCSGRQQPGGQGA